MQTEENEQRTGHQVYPALGVLDDVAHQPDGGPEEGEDDGEAQNEQGGVEKHPALTGAGP